ncbi:SUMF1/EgtB/PvdO family nonheme iron enzyme [Pseudanabaena galeata UHCC 0370]|uniref:SUMF1/EgtB/PvdO family nonheme iron enzyme n=1 Tax=Pseudanabaena galeata UHCC 0370 TaxID=3110310 RepID=A0ABU5TH68_9CYAN|nr:SUMF1/EgtB/PvdO family nonheme iron enzyme [Pseudanabaena galeata]MEA5477477.1 SUMF1/EgtB/PvdO family nonheme iron enzyme [Pseudanabaena galeata UHCC 0370]
MGRYALLIGISNYNAGLNPLPSAVKDVDALQEVLLNAEIGGFADGNVTVLKDAEKGAIETAIYHLFANRKPDDLLLFYFSGHGVTDDRRDFYFTGLSTSREALPPTAVSSSYVQSQMYNSRSKRQVAILDCCHSGAFPKGMMAKDVGTVDIKLGGEGQAILTAADSSQYAFEQEGFELSLYTHFLVEGLKTGAADRDEDGDVSVDELHLYVEGKVKSVNNSMSPKFFGQKEGHRIVLARAAQDDPKLRFRKEVEKVVKRSNGKISIIARNLLLGKSQGLDSLEVETIINEVKRPYDEYDRKLKKYEQDLADMIAEEFPFSEVVQQEIKEYENHLGLREDDIKVVKARVIAPRQAEHDRQFEEQQQKVAEAERLKRQQEDAEQLRLQQVAAAESQKQEQDRLSLLDQLKRQAEEEERRKRQREEAERKSIPVQAEFEFEIVKARLVKENSGFMGLVRETKVKLERKKGKAQYIRENLGNGATLSLVQIPAGKFMMGSNKFSSEQPIHEATLRKFWMGKYVVTNAQWQAIMGTKPSKQYDVKFQGENQPVVGVLWDDAKEFCEKASQKTGKLIRLPSETEWEYACRAGTTTPFHFGETITPDLVNYNGNHPYGYAPEGEYRQKTVT